MVGWREVWHQSCCLRADTWRIGAQRQRSANTWCLAHQKHLSYLAQYREWQHCVVCCCYSHFYCLLYMNAMYYFKDWWVSYCYPTVSFQFLLAFWSLLHNCWFSKVLFHFSCNNLSRWSIKTTSSGCSTGLNDVEFVRLLIRSIAAAIVSWHKSQTPPFVWSMLLFAQLCLSSFATKQEQHAPCRHRSNI